MRTHTETFKDNLTMMGRQYDVEITYTIDNEEIILTNEKLNFVEPIVQGDILKSSMKELKVDSNVDIPLNTVINLKIGLLDYDNDEYEYLDYGNYYVISSELQEDTHSYLLTCYDKMILSMKDYEGVPLIYPATVRDYITELCETIGITFANENDTFANYDKEIPSDLYKDLGYTYRDVLDELAQVTASTICINNNDELEIRYITTTPGKNLLNKELFVQGSCNYGTAGSVPAHNASATNRFTIIPDNAIEVKPNTAYTFNTTYTSPFALAQMTSEKISLGDTGWKATSTLPFTITTSATTKYIAFNFQKDNATTIDTVKGYDYQLEEGSSATSYEPFDYGDVINEEYFDEDDVVFKQKYGPINSIVLSRAAGSDNVFLRDEDSIAENGLTEIKIEDNQIMNFDDRSDFLPDILEKLDGLEYYPMDVKSKGILYYELCDRYKVEIGENAYTCVLFNDEITVEQAIEEHIYVDIPEKAETDYKKADTTDRKLNQTTLIVDKQQGEISALTSRTDTMQDALNNTYTIEQVNTLIQNAETGLTNTFSTSGGNNIFRNTGLWFATDDENNPYEFWNGKVVRQGNDKASNNSSMILQNDTLSQEQRVPNGKHTISFKYKKLAFASTVTCKINDISYDLTATEDTEFLQTIDVASEHINIQFISDTNDACEIYDLMVNTGETKYAYSQNQNETTTDTVNISKGITISSSDTDTTFRADASGIKTIDRYGNELTKFTDKGMRNKEMIIEDQAEIVGVLIQEVDGQTWFTRM